MRVAHLRFWLLVPLLVLSSCGGDGSSEPLETYTVTWENWDGSILEVDRDVPKGSTASYDGNTPTHDSDARATYVFTNWHPEPGPVINDTVYHALFSDTVKSYVITWEVDGVKTTESYEYGELPSYKGGTPIKESDARYSYRFSGWSSLLAPVTCDKTYTAMFREVTNSYVITWKDEDGSVLTITSVEYGSMPSYGGVPAKEDDAQHYYTFDRWNPELTVATSDATYTASYTQHQCDHYTISYNANGGTGAPSKQRKARGDSVELWSEVPTKDGYEFAGWNNIYEDAVYQPCDEFSLDSNVTLWAMWKKDCETCGKTGKVASTKTCSSCWGSGKVCKSCGSHSITRVAGLDYYKCNSCGSLSIGNCSSCSGQGKWSGLETCGYCSGLGYTKEDAPITSLLEPRKIELAFKEGYEYSKDGKSWQENAVFDGLIPKTKYSFYQRRATKGNVPFGCTSNVLTLTTPADTTYYITYDLNGGVNDSRNPSSYETDGSSIALYSPTKEHYDFVGWTYNGSTITSVPPSWEIDVTLVANWKATGYGITYDLDGGRADNPTSHGIESGEIKLNAPTRNGYTFLGWTGSNGETPELEVAIPAGNTHELSYKANWSLNTYTITYELDGGTNPESNPSTYTVLDGTIMLAEPSKSHYDFKGWKNGSTFVSKIYASSAKDFTLTAVWTPHEYSIQYDLDGGTSTNPETHNIESDDITLTDPTRDGYTFTGWTGSNGESPSKDVTIPSGNTDELSYKANWSLDTYSITYVLNGGSNALKNPSTYTTEDSIALKDATKGHYTFEGWYKEPEFINEVETLEGQFGDLTLYAKFSPKTYSCFFDSSDSYYTLTYSCGDASLDKVDKITKNDVVKIYDYIPKKDGFIFDGWLDDDGNLIKDPLTLTKDTVLHAKWWEGEALDLSGRGFSPDAYAWGGGTTNKREKFLIFLPSYCNEGVEVNWSVRASYKKKSGKVSSGNCQFKMSDVTEGKTIVSYFLASSSRKVSESGTASLIPGHAYEVVLYASVSGDASSHSYCEISTCTFNNFSSVFSESSVVAYDSSLETQIPHRDGYDFAGWYDENNNPIHSTWDYVADQSFHAEWTFHHYSVNYNLDGGTNSSSNPSTFICADNIELSNPSKNGYTFDGWYTDSAFENKVTAIDGARCTDLTLYVKWIPNTYVATLNYNGGQNCPVVDFYDGESLIKSVVLYKDSTLSYFAPKSSDSSLIFAGWYRDEELTNPFSFEGNVNQGTKLYAKWVSKGDAYSSLGSDVEVTIEGKTEKYIEIISPTDQAILIRSTSDFDLYGTIYDESMNLIASSDDISDEDLNFGIDVTLEAGKKYYILYRANQASVNGEAVINIGGTQAPSSHITGDYTEVIETIDVTSGSSFSLPTPHKEGYEFLGWFDANGKQVDTSSWDYAKNMTLYARWHAL